MQLPCEAKDHFTVAMHTLTIIVPHAVTLVLGLLTYLKVMRTGKGLKRVEKALNGKVSEH